MKNNITYNLNNQRTTINILVTTFQFLLKMSICYHFRYFKLFTFFLIKDKPLLENGKET